MTYEPPADMIEQARRIACASPCAKSKRGVVAYIPPTADQGVSLFTSAFNSPPPPAKCSGSDACKRDCAKLCTHAEGRALSRLREMNASAIIDQFVLVHVKVDGTGRIAVSKGPSCWQCSRELVEAGVAGIWLLEAPNGTWLTPAWIFYTAIEFHAATLKNLQLGDQ